MSRVARIDDGAGGASGFPPHEAEASMIAMQEGALTAVRHLNRTLVMKPPDSIVPYPAAAALAAAVVALVPMLLSPGGVAPLDDTYIHLVFGRNLAHGGFMEFSPGRPSTGLTAPAWLPFSALASTAGGSAGVTAIMAMSVAFGALAAAAAGGAGMVLALCGPFILHASSGMETALAALLAVLLTRRLVDGTGTGLTDGLLLAAGLLARPEMAVLALPLLWRARRTPGRLVRILLPAAVAGGAWASWNLTVSGSMLPSTFHAKSAALGGILRTLPPLVPRLVLAGPLMLPFSALGCSRLLRRRNPGGLCAPLLLLAALATQPNAWFQLRYYVPFLASAAVTATAWAERHGRGGFPRVALLCSMIPGALFFGHRRVMASIDVGSLDVAAALFVAGEAAPGDVVAAADIGALAWITGLEVVDLDGLVTPERLPGPGMEGWPWIAERAGWLSLFPCQYGRLLEEAGDDLVFAAGFRSPHPVICGSDSLAVWRISD